MHASENSLFHSVSCNNLLQHDLVMRTHDGAGTSGEEIKPDSQVLRRIQQPQPSNLSSYSFKEDTLAKKKREQHPMEKEASTK